MLCLLSTGGHCAQGCDAVSKFTFPGKMNLFKSAATVEKERIETLSAWIAQVLEQTLQPEVNTTTDAGGSWMLTYKKVAWTFLQMDDSAVAKEPAPEPEPEAAAAAAEPAVAEPAAAPAPADTETVIETAIAVMTVMKKSQIRAGERAFPDTPSCKNRHCIYTLAYT